MSGSTPERPLAKREICSHPGCRQPAHAKGLCQKHYDKLRRTGGRRSAAESDKTCRAAGCSRPYHAKGYCQKHYDLYRKRSGAPPADGPAPDGTPVDPHACRVPGCSRPHHAKGYCKSHYSQLRRRGGIPAVQRPAGICEVEGCTRPAIANGRCARHMGHPGTAKKGMSKAERLKLLKHRHEIIKREIAMINQALEDDD